MYLVIEVCHTIKEGKEREALQMVKELTARELDYRGGTTPPRGLLLADTLPGLSVTDGYRDHLGKVFSRVRRVTDMQAKIEVRLRT